MEDPTAPSSGFDDEEDVESEEERDMRRLVYLLRVPDEWAGPEEMKNTVTYLINWAKVLSVDLRVIMIRINIDVTVLVTFGVCAFSFS